MNPFAHPPAISEDTLQYIIHPGPSFSSKSAVTTLAVLINSHVAALLPNHIWHKDSFELKVVKDPSNGEFWMIEGRMRVGDCVDDEWCVVWLLREITQRWDVAINVFDSDGDFLLIEAAEFLPAWITPANSENRVWLYNSRLHIVPFQYSSPSGTKRERRTIGGVESDDEGDQDGDSNYISASDAVDLVRNMEVNTLATPDVERSAFKRIEGYPAVAHQHLHRTKAYVPVDLVRALSREPSLVQKATEAFYTRDALQLRVAARMSRFTPDTSVLKLVTMTRTAYAQLMGQKFHPPKVFGQWKEEEGSSEWRCRDIGMKIACGFEMLYQESKNRHGTGADGATDGSDVSVEARKEALRRDPEYVKYIQTLQGAGFFKGEIEGSAIWREQENQAATQFLLVRQKDDANRPSFAFMVESAILRAQTCGPPSELVGEEDSDDWLYVDEATVDNILLTHSQHTEGQIDMDLDHEDQQMGTPEDKYTAEQASQLRALATKVERFVEGDGDVDGATFEDDILSEESDMSGLSDSDGESTPDPNAEDAANVADSERQAAMDKLVPALEPSEYGTMPPSFYKNSQTVKREKVTLAEEEQMGDNPIEDVSGQSRPMRRPIFPRDQFDGVEDSDDESEDEEVNAEEDDDEDEERPLVVGEVEVDMQEEEEEFLTFSRDILGISSDMWKDIVEERKRRGAFLPRSVLREESIRDGHTSSQTKVPTNKADVRSQGFSPGVSPNRNSELDSFEAVMKAMDAELSRAKRDKQATEPKVSPTVSSLAGKSEDKGKRRAENDEDVEADMDAELRGSLQEFSDDEDESRVILQETNDEGGGEIPMNYTLMKNFLESFKSQQGLPGPVSSLVGRLGWQLPRDDDETGGLASFLPRRS